MQLDTVVLFNTSDLDVSLIGLTACEVSLCLPTHFSRQWDVRMARLMLLCAQLTCSAHFSFVSRDVFDPTRMVKLMYAKIIYGVLPNQDLIHE